MKQLVKKLWQWSAGLKFLGLSLIIIGLTLLLTGSWRGDINTWAAVNGSPSPYIPPMKDTTYWSPPSTPFGSLLAIYQLAGTGPTDQVPDPPPGNAQEISIPTNFNTNDGQYLTTILSNIDHGWDGQVFKFQITNYQAGLGRITVTWQGYGESTEGYPVRVDIYNFQSSNWELEYNAQTSYPGTTINFNLSDNFDQYINDQGIFWVRVRADNLELAAPTNVSAQAVASNEARLSWNDNSINETGYQVEVKEENATEWITLDTLPADTTVYTDYDINGTRLLSSYSYQYRIQAVAGATASIAVASNQVQMPARGIRPGPQISVPTNAATIQEAVNLAQANDTVNVAAGIYNEAVVIRRPLTLKGAAVFGTTISPPAGCLKQYCSAVTVETNNISETVVENLVLQNGSGLFYNNSRSGGGVAVKGSAAALQKLVVMNNQAVTGAAIALIDSLGVQVKNVAALGNISSNGAAVWVSGGPSGVVFKHVTVANNTSGGSSSAGGLWQEGHSGSLQIINSIFWHNSAAKNEIDHQTGGSLTVNYSLVGPITIPLGGQSNINQNPQLFGAFDPHLDGSSPAINQGSFSDGLPDDYESRARPVQYQYDLGASEFYAQEAPDDLKDVPMGEPGTPGNGTTSTKSQFYKSGALPVITSPKPHASLNTDSIILEVIGVMPPTAPSNFQVINIGDDRVTIKWMDNATDPAAEQGFTLYRNNEVAATIPAHTGTGEVLYTDFGNDLPNGSLSPGTQYCYQVKAYNGSLYSDPAPGTPLCINTTGSPGQAPSPPSNVLSTAISALQIKIQWTDMSNDEEGFLIYRKRFNEGSYTIVSPPAMPNTTSYVDWGGDIGSLLPGTTYCYQVAAYNIHGLSTAVPANGACGTTLYQTIISTYESGGADTQQPSLTNLGTLREVNFSETDAPGIGLETNFNFDSNNAFNWQIFAIQLDTTPGSLSSLDLKWRGRGENLANYPIKFLLYNFSSGLWESQRIFNDGQSDEGEVRDLTTYTINLTSLQLVQKYVGPWGGNSNMLLFWVRAKAFVQPPAAPLNLVAQPDPAPTTIYLQWQDMSTNETGFEVQRQGKDSEWSTLTTRDAGSTSYNDTAVTLASAWKYRIIAKRGGIASNPSNELGATSSFYEPASISVGPGGVESSIRVQWALNTNNGNRFANNAYQVEIFRSPGDICSYPAQANWTKVGEAPGLQKSFNDTGLLLDTDYSYRLRFRVTEDKQDYYSRYSSPVCTRTPAPGAPLAPANLQAAAVLSTQIDLSWGDVANETWYTLERQAGLTGMWQTVASAIGADFTTYGDVGLLSGILYQYRLKACNDYGCSPYSEVDGATTSSTAHWQVINTLPNINSLAPGATVLASHYGGLYAASNIADDQGQEPWSYLDVFLSSTNGASWTKLGSVPPGITNNMVVAMTSFASKLYLLTGSRLWRSANGITWAEEQPQGVGDWPSNGMYSHMTVFNSRLYVLFNEGVLRSTDGFFGWITISTPGGFKALAQYNNQLVAYKDGVSPNQIEIYTSANGTTWSLLTTISVTEAGSCNSFNGLVGLSSSLYIGAQGSGGGQPCLRANTSGGGWLLAGPVDIWPALFITGGIGLIGSSEVTPGNVSARLNGDTGVLEKGLPVSGVADGYRLWSIVKLGDFKFGAMFAPNVAAPTIIVKLFEP